MSELILDILSHETIIMIAKGFVALLTGMSLALILRSIVKGITISYHSHKSDYMKLMDRLHELENIVYEMKDFIEEKIEDGEGLAV